MPLDHRLLEGGFHGATRAGCAPGGIRQPLLRGHAGDGAFGLIQDGR
ncbi:hypothetical protein [Sphingomonas pseudosanguinis]|uniref:Uncharacterized protein n=2 Tax=Sphingomonas pseudosanguinis TaxID=413712 RepID=A0A7W6F3B6_9SPHN|nr:hypothetical protein [Sphingomonas pseudosanguinis]MBB3879796.1 hypothetical protein [Sphingomonas pseudosanguinis]